MNKSVILNRLLALLLLACMAISMVSCDVINGVINGKHEHSFTEGKCECGETDPNFKPETPADGAINATIAELTAKFDKEATFRVTATVKEVINTVSGEMVIEDETGSITVNALFGKDETSYGELEAKPDEADEIVITCNLQKKSGKVTIVAAFIESFEAKEPELETITIAEALALAAQYPEGTTEMYYIRATIKSMVNPTYGEMYITDETGEIYVYGTRGADGETFFDKLPERPVKGDEVLLLCTLSQYNGESQVKIAHLISFTHVEVEIDPSMYADATIAEARAAEVDTLLKVKGVVARITYSNGKVPQGVILVDGTSSIYVYGVDVAGQVSIGNTIEVAAKKAYYVLSSEQSNADKFGYKGACQLDEAILLSNDKGNTEFDKSWITESTVKEIMDTPYSEDITNLIFKVNALVKKAPGNGFINYYIDDIDGKTGSYVYTQCSGGDFEWLDQFDGKICTVYLVAQNAKSTSSGCTWRFLPVEVIDEGYTFNTDDAGKYAVLYEGIPQFMATYTGDPAINLITSVSSELLGFTGATLSYSSSNEAVVSFTTENGVTTFHGGEPGTATVTITGTFNGKSHSETIEIEIKEAPKFDTISIADAAAKEVGTEVYLHGIVGPSAVNQPAFYLFDESGMIAVRLENGGDFASFEIGDEVVIKGLRDLWHQEGFEHGQIVISNATVAVNYYGDHDYLTIDPIEGKDIAYINGLDKTDLSEAMKLYVITATVKVVDEKYYSNIYLVDGDNELLLYASNSSQYSWLKAYVGQTVTVELAPCNWNSKAVYRGCVLSVILEDGTKDYNNFNFK